MPLLHKAKDLWQVHLLHGDGEKALLTAPIEPFRPRFERRRARGDDVAGQRIGAHQILQPF